MVRVGDIVKYQGVRGQVRLIYMDAPYVAVITFPQDVGCQDARHYEDWPIKDLEPYRTPAGERRMSESTEFVRLLTAEQAAEMLGRPKAWVYKNKHLPKRYVGRELRFHPQELLDFTSKPQTTYPDMAVARQSRKVEHRNKFYD